MQEEAKKDSPKSVDQAAQKPAEAALETQKPVKKEKPTNCSVCNKAIRKTQKYYRNGKYFCTKRCWKTTVKKPEAAVSEPQQNPAAAA